MFYTCFHFLCLKTMTDYLVRDLNFVVSNNLAISNEMGRLYVCLIETKPDYYLTH